MDRKIRDNFHKDLLDGVDVSDLRELKCFNDHFITECESNKIQLQNLDDIIKELNNVKKFYEKKKENYEFSDKINMSYEKRELMELLINIMPYELANIVCDYGYMVELFYKSKKGIIGQYKNIYITKSEYNIYFCDILSDKLINKIKLESAYKIIKSTIYSDILYLYVNENNKVYTHKYSLIEINLISYDVKVRKIDSDDMLVDFMRSCGLTHIIHCSDITNMYFDKQYVYIELYCYNTLVAICLESFKYVRHFKKTHNIIFGDDYIYDFIIMYNKLYLTRINYISLTINDTIELDYRVNDVLKYYDVSFDKGLIIQPVIIEKKYISIIYNVTGLNFIVKFNLENNMCISCEKININSHQENNTKIKFRNLMYNTLLNIYVMTDNSTIYHGKIINNVKTGYFIKCVV